VLYGLWGDAKDNLYMVGSQGNVLYFDGEAWEPSGLFTTTNLRGVWGTSGKDVYVVGDKGIIMHYDGTKWSFMASNTGQDLYSIWGTSANDIFAVGSYSTVIHYGDLNAQTTKPNQTSSPPTDQTNTTPDKQGVPQPRSTNWGLIVGIAGAVVVVGGVVTGLSLNRRTKKTTPN